MPKQQWIVILVVALIAVSGGYFAQKWWYSAGTLVLKGQPTQSQISGSQQDRIKIKGRRPDFTLLDLEKNLRSITEWDGKVILVNFWATWCPPCVREIPALNKVYNAYKDKGFVVIGIAIDSRDAVIDFVDPLALDYPILIATQQGISLSQAYGNRLGVLPYSVLIDRKGNIVYSHRSELTYQQVEAQIKPLLQGIARQINSH